jgi:hypothetical protein
LRPSTCVQLVLYSLYLGLQRLDLLHDFGVCLLEALFGDVLLLWRWRCCGRYRLDFLGLELEACFSAAEVRPNGGLLAPHPERPGVRSHRVGEANVFSFNAVLVDFAGSA